MQRVLDIGDRAESIRSELNELFPGTSFEVDARRGVLSGIIVVKWTDGPALTRVQETGMRERYDRVLVEERTGNKARTGSVFVKYERGYSSLGKPQSIPTTLTEATFTFKFKVLPEERLKELRRTSILQYGVGYQHAIYVGTVILPLFNVYVNAEDNHLYIYFGGTLTAGGRRDIYPFGSWTVDLGDVSGFSEYVDFTIWLDLANKSFKKIFIGGKEVPFPPGYEEIKPQVLQSYMYKGVLIAESGGVHTNVKVMLDDVAVYGEYFTPQPPVPNMLWIGLGLGLLIGVGLIYFTRK